jgi:hypothetical protein
MNEVRIDGGGCSVGEVGAVEFSGGIIVAAVNLLSGLL